MEQTGRLTLPTDADVVEETLRLKALLGADALRDCDGTETWAGMWRPGLRWQS